MYSTNNKKIGHVLISCCDVDKEEQELYRITLHYFVMVYLCALLSSNPHELVHTLP
jgi:hypothetical protein